MKHLGSVLGLISLEKCDENKTANASVRQVIYAMSISFECCRSPSSGTIT